MSLKLSIVVPFYNVEQYIEPCLRSIARQTMTAFEVIMVDDGSQDASGDVAATYAAKDERFRVVRQANAGLGPARNTGVQYASGEFLTFVDSDDLVPRHAYELMIGSLDETGSDFVAGDARRFNSYGVRDSWVHIEPFARTRKATHVSAFQPLALDRMAWNKVFRREFWDDHEMAFPPILYEDYPVTIRAHVLATSVDALHHPVYYWRERDGGDLSITQRAAELSNLRDRMTSADMVMRFLDQNAPDIKHLVVSHLLHIDLNALIGGIRGANDDDSERILAMARTLLGSMDAASLAVLPPVERLQNALVERNMLQPLRELLVHRRAGGGRDQIRRRGRLRPRYFVDLPFFGDRRLDLPDRVYEVDRSSFGLDVRIEDVVWDGDELRISGRAAIGPLQMTPESRIETWLESADGRRLSLTTVRFPVVRQTGRLEDAGFELRVYVEDLRGAAEWRPTDWVLHVGVRCGRERCSGPVMRVSPGRAQWAPYREPERGVWVIPQLLQRGVFALQVRRVGAFVDGIQRDGDAVTMTGAFTDKSTSAATLVISRHGLPSVRVPTMVVEGTELHRFSAKLLLSDIVSGADYDEPVAESTVWRPRLEVGDRARPLGVPDDFPQPDLEVGDRTVSFVRDVHRNLEIIEAHGYPTTERVVWAAAEVIRLEIRMRGADPSEAAIVLRASLPAGLDVERTFALRRGARSSVDIPVRTLVEAAAKAADPTAARPVQATWHIHMSTAAGATALHARRRLFADLPGPVIVDRAEVLVETYRRETLQLVVRRTQGVP